MWTVTLLPKSPCTSGIGLALDALIDRAVSREDCQYRKLCAVASTMNETDSTLIQSQLQDIKIENLTRKMVEKDIRIETLEKLCRSLCRRLMESRSIIFALMSFPSSPTSTTNECKELKKLNRIRRRSFRASNVTLNLKRSNELLKSKLDRIGVELTKVKQLLTKARICADKVDRNKENHVKKDSVENEPRCTAINNGKLNQTNVNSPTIAAICSVGDSGCMSDSDVTEHTISSQTCRPGYEIRQDATAASDRAAKVRSRLQMVSKKLRDLESHVARMSERLSQV